MGRARTSFIASVVRITSWISARERTSTSRRCFCRQATSGGVGMRAVFMAMPPSGRRVGRIDPLDPDRVLPVDLDEGDLDDLVAGGGDILPDVVGPDRELAVAAIHEDRQADRARPPEVHQGVHRGADRPPGVEDVVDEHDRAAVEVHRELRALDHRLLGDQREVVTVERDVQGADGEGDALVLFHGDGDPVGQGNATALDPDEHEPLGPGLLLDRPGSAAMSASSVSPTLPSAFTAKRLSRPADWSVAPAIQTARCRPDGSQRASQLVTPASPADPGSGIAVTSPGPTSACQSAVTSRPFVGIHVFVAGSRAWVPVQKTTLRFVGSTTGRQTAGRAIGVRAPVMGSSMNETTETLGGADATAGGEDAEGAACPVGTAGDGDGAA